MAITVVDLLHQDGVENPSGLATLHGFALLGYFAAAGIKKADDLNSAGATNTSIGSIITPHVFSQGNCMKKIYGTENKGEAKEDVVGETDSQATKSSITISVPGVKADYHGTKRLLNASIGLAFITMADGQVMQYGSERFPCHFKVSWGTGNNESYRGYTITITNYGDGALYTPGLNFTPAP